MTAADYAGFCERSKQFRLPQFRRFEPIRDPESGRGKDSESRPPRAGSYLALDSPLPSSK